MSERLLNFMVAMATDPEPTRLLTPAGMDAAGLRSEEQEALVNRDSAKLSAMLQMGGTSDFTAVDPLNNTVVYIVSGNLTSTTLAPPYTIATPNTVCLTASGQTTQPRQMSGSFCP